MAVHMSMYLPFGVPREPVEDLEFDLCFVRPEQLQLIFADAKLSLQFEEWV